MRVVIPSEARNLLLAGTKTKRVGDQDVPASKFAYVGDPERTETWHLPIHDESHVRNALARFNQADIPASEKNAVARKLVAAAKHYGIDASGFKKQYLNDSRRSADPAFGSAACVNDKGPRTKDAERHLAILLNGPGVPQPSDGGEWPKILHEIPIAITGTWVKGDHKFSITKQDLADIVANFEKRKNDQVVIDYEHASEQPEIAKGGPIPAAGWIHKLRWNGHSRESGNPLNGMLYALVEWTPDAERFIKSGQYRFFSPAIDWGAADKETGKPQGATLTSGALTNHPFLEELPPIMLTDFDVIPSQARNLLSAFLATTRVGAADTSTGYLDKPLTGGKMKVQMMKGPKGKFMVKYGDDVVADDLDLDDIDMDEDMMDAYMKKMGRSAGATGGSGKGKMEDEEMSELFAEKVGAKDSSLDRIKFLVDLGRTHQQNIAETQARNLLLTEAVKDGALDNQKASVLAREGKITLADYIAAQEAERTLDKAVRAGKILPRDRKFFFRDALERPKEFSEYVEKAVPVINLSSVGLGSSENIPVDQEVDLGVKKLMSDDKKLSYGGALKQLFKDNPALEQRYRAQHSKAIGGAAPAADAGITQ